MPGLLELIAIRRDNAIRRLAKLRKDALRLEAEVAEMDGFLERYGHRDFVSPVSELTPGPGEVRASNPGRLELVETVRRILLAAGEPVSRKNLLLILALEGSPIGGKDPAMNLTMAMRRAADSSGIVHRPGIGYWFADRPYPGDIPDVPVE